VMLLHGGDPGTAASALHREPCTPSTPRLSRGTVRQHPKLPVDKGDALAARLAVEAVPTKRLAMRDHGVLDAAVSGDQPSQASTKNQSIQARSGGVSAGKESRTNSKDQSVKLEEANVRADLSHTSPPATPLKEQDSAARAPGQPSRNRKGRFRVAGAPTVVAASTSPRTAAASEQVQVHVQTVQPWELAPARPQKRDIPQVVDKEQLDYPSASHIRPVRISSVSCRRRVAKLLAMSQPPRQLLAAEQVLPGVPQLPRLEATDLHPSRGYGIVPQQNVRVR